MWPTQNETLKMNLFIFFAIFYLQKTYFPSSYRTAECEDFVSFLITLLCSTMWQDISFS